MYAERLFSEITLPLIVPPQRQAVIEIVSSCAKPAIQPKYSGAPGSRSFLGVISPKYEQFEIEDVPIRCATIPPARISREPALWPFILTVATQSEKFESLAMPTIPAQTLFSLLLSISPILYSQPLTVALATKPAIPAIVPR